MTEALVAPDGAENTSTIVWRWTRLVDALAALESGARPRGGVQNASAGRLSLGAEHISHYGTIDLRNPRHVPAAFFDGLPKGRVQADDILLVKDGATTGRLALVTDDLDAQGAAINEHLFLLRARPGFDPQYLLCALASPPGQRAIRKCFQGAAQGGITRRFARLVFVPTPILPAEQRAIAARLQARLAWCGKARESCSRQVRDARQLRYALIADALSRLGDVQGHLSQVLAQPPQTGWSVNCDGKLGGTPVLTISAVLGYRYDGHQTKLTSAPVDQEASYWVEHGDILMTRSNTLNLVGHAAIYDGTPARVVFPDLLIRLRPDPQRANLRFLHLWLMTPCIRDVIRKTARGTSGTMKKITLDMVRDLPFPTHLTPQQQEATVLELRPKLASAAALQLAAELQLEATTAMRGALLNEAFGGYGRSWYKD
jgi:type I restriction enzyme S subunit